MNDNLKQSEIELNNLRAENKRLKSYITTLGYDPNESLNVTNFIYIKGQKIPRESKIEIIWEGPSEFYKTWNEAEAKGKYLHQHRDDFFGFGLKIAFLGGLSIDTYDFLQNPEHYWIVNTAPASEKTKIIKGTIEGGWPTVQEFLNKGLRAVELLQFTTKIQYQDVDGHTRVMTVCTQEDRDCWKSYCTTDVTKSDFDDVLDLSGHKFDLTPETIIMSFPSTLKKLLLSGCEFSSIPNVLFELVNLRTLDLSDNQLSSIPEAIRNLKCLMELDLSWCGFSSIPSILFELKSLKKLNLSNNPLSLGSIFLISRNIGTLPQRMEVDLSECDLSRLKLRAIDLRGVILTSVNLNGSDLREATFIDSDLQCSDLSKADMRCADLRGAYLISANLSQSNLKKATLKRANICSANLAGANLSETDLCDVLYNSDTQWPAEFDYQNSRALYIGPKVNLSGSKLEGAYLSEEDLSNANLGGTDLSGAELSGANLTRADLSGANLTRADLSEANLTRASLAGTDLQAAVLIYANLSGANLQAANLIGALYNSDTQWPDGFDPVAAGAIEERWE